MGVAFSTASRTVRSARAVVRPQGRSARRAAPPLGRHDERHHALGLCRIGIHLEVRHIGAGPLGPVPEHQLAPCIPGLAVGRSGLRCTGCGDSPARPRPSSAPTVVPGIAVVAACHLVAGLGPGPCVDPAPRCRAAVIAQPQSSKTIPRLGQQLRLCTGLPRIGCWRHQIRQKPCRCTPWPARTDWVTSAAGISSPD